MRRIYTRLFLDSWVREEDPKRLLSKKYLKDIKGKIIDFSNDFKTAYVFNPVTNETYVTKTAYLHKRSSVKDYFENYI